MKQPLRTSGNKELGLLSFLHLSLDPTPKPQALYHPGNAASVAREGAWSKKDLKCQRVQH